MTRPHVERLTKEIKREIGRIIHDEVSDPRVGFITVTKVELSKDLRVVKVHFSLLGNEKQLRDTQVGLKRSTGFIRTLLGQRVTMRYTPEIIFKVDVGVQYSIRVAEVLKQIEDEKENEHRTSK
ncbi:MAG: 30S ribosome-binding factor RbfA [Candidatus Omnitrophota bacterium]